MSQKLPSGNFKWVEETSEFNEDFKKGGNDERTFFLMFGILKIYITLTMIYPFCLRE